jgi:hypothetical protein
MPDMVTRVWIRQVAKMCGEPVSANDIAHHAQKIGIEPPNRLLTCMASSGTATARHIVRALYTKRQMEEAGSAVGFVSKDIRDSIRGKYYFYNKNCHNDRKQFNFTLPFAHFSDFITAHYGSISEYDCNEAINGVFRQVKAASIQDDEEPVVMKPIQQKKSKDGQQSIDKYCLKKPRLDMGNKSKQVSTKVIQNLNEHDEDDDEDDVDSF